MKLSKFNFLIFGITALGIFIFTASTNAQSVDNYNSETIKKRIEQSFTIEKTRRDIRIVGDGTIAKTQIILKDEIVRLPAAPSASAQKLEAKRRRQELEQIKERYYKRPLIMSAGTFQSGQSGQSGDTIIQLANIIPTDVKQICQSGAGEWPCGRFARAALRRLVRGNTIICTSPEGVEKIENRIVEDSCKTANYELGKWLVTQGWVDSNHSNHVQLRDAAKENGLGIWRK